MSAPAADVDAQTRQALDDHARAVALGAGDFRAGAARVAAALLDDGEDAERVIARLAVAALRDAFVMSRPLDDTMALTYARETVEREQRREARRPAATDDGLRVELDDWPAREPLHDALPEVPALPDALIPAALRGSIVDAAERLQVPLEMIAAPALVTVGAVIGRAIGIWPKRHDDWQVVPNLWGIVVGRPGTLKSPALDEATRPICRLAARAIERHTAASAAAEIERDRIRLMIEQAKRRGAKPTADAHAIAQELAELRAKERELVPVERRYLTQDATIEKEAELLRANPRGLLVLRDEMSGWLATLERPGREGEREFYLEAWRGTGAYTSDRIGRGTVHVPALTLSLLGTIQPGKLRGIIAAAASEGRGDDGLLQRFQVVVWPDVSATWRNVDRWPETAARERAARVYERLDVATAESLSAAATDDIPALRFAPDAQELFDAWRADLEQRLRGAEMQPYPAYESHVSKYRSLMPALALICHLVEVVDDQTPPGPVTLDAAKRAAAWVDYLDAHARRVYAVELHPGRAAARALAERIEGGDVEDGAAVRDIYRAGWSALSSRDAVDVGLRELMRLNWLRVEYEPTAGRPERVIRLHPELRRVDT